MRFIFTITLVLNLTVSMSLAHGVKGRCETCGNYASVSELREELIDVLELSDSLSRPKTQTSYASPSERFVFWYDTSGSDAVPLDDMDENGVPDFIDSTAICFEYAWIEEIDRMGFKEPLPDSAGGSDAHDVYLMDLAVRGGAYGFTVPEDPVPSKNGAERWTAFTVVDNDYSPSDSVTDGDVKRRAYPTSEGVDAMRITAAHEYHHTVQFAYGVTIPNAPSIMEMSSVWMEYAVYPDSKDYLWYVNRLFKDMNSSNFASPKSSDGYKWSIFNQYFAHVVGDHAIKRLWETIESDFNGYKAYDDVLRDNGTGLVEAWKDFLDWTYYTGDRAIEGKYFPDAALFPTASYDSIRFLPEEPIEISGTVNPFGIIPYQVIVTNGKESAPLRIDFFVTDLDEQAAYDVAESPKDFTLTISREAKPGYEPVGCFGVWYKLEGPETLYLKTFVNSIEDYVGEAYAFPNPFYKTRYDRLFFTFPTECELHDKAEIIVYDSEMNILIEDESDAETYEGRRVVSIDDDLARLVPGVYLFKIKTDNFESYGKFAVLD